jgi:hypothetical protein
MSALSQFALVPQTKASPGASLDFQPVVFLDQTSEFDTVERTGAVNVLCSENLELHTKRKTNLILMIPIPKTNLNPSKDIHIHENTSLLKLEPLGL